MENKISIGIAYAVALWALLFVSNPLRAAQCDDSLPVTGSRDDVLILVNNNSVDSCQVARYYAEQRSIGKNNIAYLAIPAVHTLDWPEFRLMMDQLIAKMLSPDLLVDDAPEVPLCGEGSASPYYCEAVVEYLRAHTKIRYLVTTRGIPALTRMPPTPYIGQSPNSFTSVDNQLSFWLVRYFPDVDNDGENDNRAFRFYEREAAFGDGRGMRTVDVAQDGELVVGRIDGVDLAAAKRLVDRAILAEQQGIYGTLYTDRFENTRHEGKMQWRQYTNPKWGATQNVYADRTTAWRYQLGLFDESRSECVDDLTYSLGGGQAPTDCRVKFPTDKAGSNGTPGQSSSRTELANDALAYFGELQGHASGGRNRKDGFTTMLNTVKNDGNCPRLCKDHENPALCRDQSTDALKEINTECVGVSNGFFGFNYQSFPVSYFSLWPTGWESPGSTGQSVPVVRNDDGQGENDNHSLWFAQHDSIATPLCHASDTSDFSETPEADCRAGFNVGLSQHIYFDTPILVDDEKPQRYQLQLGYRYIAGDSQTTNRLRVGVEFYDGKDVYTVPTQTIETFSTAVDWTLVAPYEFSVPEGVTQFDRVRVAVHAYGSDAGGRFGGELGLDSFSLTEVGSTQQLLRNGDFDQGHHQTSTGDHAAMYLSRLNGTAFWGSVSHYESGGHSFGVNPLETLIYFVRGLPLGDAVWWGESHNSGIFYGDPLYSPIAVRLHPINDYDFVAENSTVDLTGSVFNGNDPAVSVSYQLTICNGDDFYLCDRDDGWSSVDVSGLASGRDIALGRWDTQGVLPGTYTLRLTMTSQNTALNRQQSFNDYQTIVIYDPAGDHDGDGLSNQAELNEYGTNPLVADTDGDRINDGDEILVHQTSAVEADSDDDGLTDYYEITLYGTNPNNSDSDGDGMSDHFEVSNGRDPVAAPIPVEETAEIVDTSL